MKCFRQIILAAMMALVVTACSPIYSTTYELIPPNDQMGKMCMMQCEQLKATCEQTNIVCSTAQMSCESTARLEKERCYANAGDNFAAQKNCDWNARKCNVCSKQDCDSNYRTCFATCGGKVIPHTECTAYCDQVQKPMPRQ